MPFLCVGNTSTTLTVVQIDFSHVQKGFKSKHNLQEMLVFMNVFCLHFVSEQLFNLKLLTEPDLGAPIVFTAHGWSSERSKNWERCRIKIRR